MVVFLLFVIEVVAGRVWIPAEIPPLEVALCFLALLSEACRARGTVARSTERRSCFLGPLLQFAG